MVMEKSYVIIITKGACYFIYYYLVIRGGLGIADQSGVFKISFKNIFKEALAK